ncbi:MAG TPA: hypothetical protein PKV42_04995 [Thiobacillus sp.]|nr:MAG: hypothetical protein B7Y27_02290 [Hydrogenophilales bacterium 16-64-40]OZA35482.1 MAG: hypothetical protein B7X82_00315 [Hydrogenophilales bacterium 17-64-65]HQS81802.1 hypothetical protein [Thiobacillus sp.]HQT34402.1 hypothetical protein [Thiobacillus sp.]
MLRTLLIATALVAASGTAIARDDYGHGRVVSVEPNFTISFGTRHHDGFRVLYESGGARYWTHSPYHPGHVIVLPPPHRVTHVRHYRDYGYRDYGYRDYGHGWDDRRDWKDRHDGRRDDRREHHSDRRDHRRD